MAHTGAEIQLEDGGWSKLHNKIWELLAQANLTSREFRCLMFLFRQTYGYQKKADAISLSQWEQGTGIRRGHIKVTLDRLEAKRIIIKSGGKRGRGNTAVYGFNKYFEQWRLDESGAEKDPTGVLIKKDPTGVLIREKKVPTGGTEKDPTGVPTKEKRNKQLAAGFSRNEYVVAFEHYTGRMVASPYEGEKIQDWEKRVTLDGWKAALQKTPERRPTSFWRYIETILLDYEQNGYQAQAEAQAEETVNFSVEEMFK